MHRRIFIKTLTGGTAALLMPSCTLTSRPLRFGMVTDSHYAQKDRAGARYYRDSLQKMRQAVDAFNRSRLDFIIELGDMKDMGEKAGRSQTELENEAIGFLREIEGEFQRFNGPCYHVLGNHDEDCISKEQFLANTQNHGKAQGLATYSFIKKGVKFIALDGNFNEDRTPYCKGNFQWQKAYIPDEQIAWLEEELSATNLPVVIFCHQMLDRFSDIDPDLCIGNAEDVVSVLERHGNVLAVLQGHHHSGHYSSRRGIHYWTTPGMIEKEFPAHNSYAIVEIDKRGNITIEGFADCGSRDMARE